MATVQIFNSFKEAVAEKVHNLGSDTLKFMLTNTAPSLANAVKADLTEIAAGFGYTAGGTAVTVSSSAQSGGTYSLVLAACTFTAAGGSIGPFRYVVLYNDTATNDELIGFVDYGASYTLPNGQPFTITAGTFLTNA
jgi:hypothetical protein